MREGADDSLLQAVDEQLSDNTSSIACATQNPGTDAADDDNLGEQSDMPLGDEAEHPSNTADETLQGVLSHAQDILELQSPTSSVSEVKKCTCTFGNEKKGCLSQFTETEMELIR
jgi:hypothetical protein